MRSKLIDLFTRVITKNDKTEVFNSGIDNNYPERIEAIINNSVTAKLSAGKMADYILGQGFTEGFNSAKVNEKKNLTGFDIGRFISKSVSYQKGFYLHINYDISGEPNYLDVLPFKNCRISKKDDLGYEGVIFVSEEWGNEEFSFSTKKEKWFYPYNPNKDVINKQRRKDFKISYKKDPEEQDAIKAVKNYRGQVLFVNLEPENIYPLAYVDVVYNDADSEYRLSIKKNSDVRNGFLDKTIITTAKGDDKKATEKIDEDIKNLLGEDGGNVWRLESEVGPDGKLVDVVNVQTIKASIDDKLFINAETTIENNILNAFNNIPKVLVKTSDGALFGANGETLITSQEYYQDETLDERMVVEKTLNRIYGEKFGEIKIVPLIDQTKQPEEEIEDEL